MWRLDGMEGVVEEQPRCLQRNHVEYEGYFASLVK
jgi:hypothetical protein